MWGLGTGAWTLMVVKSARAHTRACRAAAGSSPGAPGESTEVEHYAPALSSYLSPSLGLPCRSFSQPCANGGTCLSLSQGRNICQ